MKEKLNISLIITIATILLSVGGSWGVLNLKAQELDKLKVKIDATELKAVVMESKLDDIKESTKEIQSDLKDLMKRIK